LTNTLTGTDRGCTKGGGKRKGLGKMEQSFLVRFAGPTMDSRKTGKNGRRGGRKKNQKKTPTTIGREREKGMATGEDRGWQQGSKKMIP